MQSVTTNPVAPAPSSPLPLPTPSLIEWHRRTFAPYPWRAEPAGQRDPYRVWIAEIMAQQTRLATVAPYFERWIAAFPDIWSVARATDEDVLKAWMGLGYYRRALNIRRAALIMTERHGGRVPAAKAELLALPGIGRYTAGAILCLAFNQPEPAIDGNVARLFSRLRDRAYAAARVQDVEAIDGQIREILNANPALPPGVLAEALMSLGSSVCLPRVPRCEQCPLTAHCQTYLAGRPFASQALAPPRALPVRRFAGLILTTRRKDGCQILLVRRKKSAMLGGLWGFPTLPLAASAQISDGQLKAWVQATLGLEAQNVQRAADVTHDYSHFRCRQQTYLAECEPALPRNLRRQWAAVRWIAWQEWADCPVSALDAKMVRLLKPRADEPDPEPCGLSS